MTPMPAVGTIGHSVPWGLLAWVTLLAFIFAKLEIQIEGEHGWAARLPTWRLSSTSPFRYLFGGRTITGYHLYAFTFMAAVFHLPFFISLPFCLQTEAKILAALALFWVLEDFLWFVINPAFGLSRFRSRHIPWHPYWFLGLPADYWVMIGAAGLLLCFSSGGTP